MFKLRLVGCCNDGTRFREAKKRIENISGGSGKLDAISLMHTQCKFSLLAYILNIFQFKFLEKFFYPNV